MRHVALIYNPASGQDSPRRKAVIDDALTTLRKVGIRADALETSEPGSASALVIEAVRQGCDAVLAFGGDGTVHEIMQCLVGTTVAIGVVPLGTANALASDLGMGTTPAKAIERLLTAVPVRVPVGKISYRGSQGEECFRYFTVAAGVGADALFMSRLDAGLKRRFGYLLYIVEGLKVLATHSFPLFRATFYGNGAGKPRAEEVSQLLAVRIADFGGMVRKLAPGATLRKETLSLVAFRTRNRLHFMLFMLAVVFRRQTFARQIELVDAVSVECDARSGSQENVFVEADGELLGTLPVRIEIVPGALTFLIPKAIESR